MVFDKTKIQYFDFGKLEFNISTFKVEILNYTFPVLKLEFNISTLKVEILNSSFKTRIQYFDFQSRNIEF